MALYGVIADIHGNLEALEAVLAELDGRGVQRLLCLGDIVGYNADPDECAAIVRGRKALAIAGNHDLIGIGRLGFRRCSNIAKYALKRTRRSLARETREYLATLPPYRLVEESVLMVHGGVRDVQQYMASPALVAHNAALAREDFPEARLCFFGHSHEQKIWEVDDHGAVQELSLPEGAALRRDRLVFVNPGSVDASRKSRSKRAECAVLDTSRWTVDFLRVAYDAAATEVKAATFGYRITPAVDRLYDWQRRFRRFLPA
jgi:predicted phosphodiesterase